MTTTYRCEAETLDGFLAQLIRYVASGHYFYVTGRIPERKDPEQVDRKLIQLYGLGKPKWERARRRLGDHAGIHYLRCERFFVLIATHGRHAFFEDHEKNLCDIRRTALKVNGLLGALHDERGGQTLEGVRATRQGDLSVSKSPSDRYCKAAKLR